MSEPDALAPGQSNPTGLARALALGERRSAGTGAPSVAEMVAADLSRLPELVDCLFDGNADVAMRAADALERLAQGDARRLDPFVGRLLSEASAIPQTEVRWHLARLLPSLGLDAAGRERAATLLEGWLANETSRLLRSAALQGLVDLAARDETFRPRSTAAIELALRSGVPTLVERARRILTPFEVDRATLDAVMRAPAGGGGAWLTILPEPLAVLRLAPGEGPPPWLDWSDPLVSATSSGNALTILCREDRVPDHMAAERGWRAFRATRAGGDLFSLIAKVAPALAAAGLPLFALQGGDADYLLVRAEAAGRASAILRRCGALPGDA